MTHLPPDSTWAPRVPPVAADAIDRSPVTVVHYWAIWNMHDREMEARLATLRGEYAGRIDFRACDIDRAENRPFIEGIGNVPALRCFIQGKRHQTIIGLRARDELHAIFDHWAAATVHPHDPAAGRPLAYDTAAPPRAAAGWARAFVISGTYAVACIPTVFIFERLRWSEAPLHTTSYLACMVCVVSASMYLWSTRTSVTGTPRPHDTTRLLAYVALALAGGFLILVAVLVILVTLTVDDF